MTIRPSDIRGPFDFGALDTARIVVTGANGAGKSWLATRLAQRLGHPVIHKDALALQRGWTQRPKPDVQADLIALVVRPTWVLDSGPTGLTPDTLARATLVIWLDPPVWLRFWRVLTRSLRYVGRTRPEHPAGNRDWPGRRQWRFLMGTIRKSTAFDQAIEEGLNAAPTIVLRLITQQCVKRLLGGLKAAGKGAKRL